LFRTLLITTAAVGLIAAPAMAQAQKPAPAAPIANAPNPDPWESTNRELFKVNKGLDRAVIRPTTVFYHHAVPTPARQGVHNVVTNLGEPVTFLNEMLQARPRRASKTVVRFAVNSTVGVLGVFDVTSGMGIPRSNSGFADTLNRYGVGQGPYIFIPVLGPSSGRDLTGRVVDLVTDPLTFLKYDGRVAVQTTVTVATGLDQRLALDPQLKDVERTATDPYATERSAFLQVTAATGDSERDAKALPDFGPEPGAPQTPQTAPKAGAPAQPAPQPHP